MNKYIDTIKLTITVMAAIGTIVIIAFGGWKFERWINYKMNYQGQVQDEIAPVIERINDLEKRVTNLERK